MSDKELDNSIKVVSDFLDSFFESLKNGSEISKEQWDSFEDLENISEGIKYIGQRI